MSHDQRPKTTAATVTVISSARVLNWGRKRPHRGDRDCGGGVERVTSAWGSKVTAGGAAGLLTIPTSRNLYALT
jgi:hypothetical protein